MRKCFLHIGTHKTATTSIQHFLNDHRRELAICGWLYPRVGRPEGARAGHHNLAWEISGDRRFREDYGNMEALIREVADSDRNIIISSEDFECSAHRADKFGEFIAAIQRLGIKVSLIIYLRNQTGYAESLYCTLIHQGFDRPFSAFCDEILESGAIQWRDWIFPFRYNDFIANLANFASVEVIVRSYDHPATGSPILEFFSAVGIGDLGVSWQELPHQNRRPGLSDSVHRYWINRGSQSLHEADVESIAHLVHGFNESWPTMSSVRQKRFAEAFDESNFRLCEKYQLPPIELMKRDKSAAIAGPSLDDIFGPDIRAVLPATADPARHSTK